MLAIADRDLLGLRLAVRGQGAVALTFFHSLPALLSLLPGHPFSPRALAQAPVPLQMGWGQDRSVAKGGSWSLAVGSELSARRAVHGALERGHRVGAGSLLSVP